MLLIMFFYEVSDQGSVPKEETNDSDQDQDW